VPSFNFSVDTHFFLYLKLIEWLSPEVILQLLTWKSYGLPKSLWFRHSKLLVLVNSAALLTFEISDNRILLPGWEWTLETSS
jgi:hypothetical protein